MKVSSTELPPRQLSLAIEVEQERLDQAMDEAYRRLSGRVDVPGFRRGRAPRPLVERMIGRERIVEEALDRLLPAVVTEAMEQEKVEPYTRPRVESIEFEPLRLKAVVGLAPKVELGDYKSNLRVHPEQPKLDDEQVDAVIQRLLDSHAQWVPVERGVQAGDRVGLDLRAVVDSRETPLLDSKDAEYVVDAAGAQPAPGFAEQLIGLSAGETRTFTLTMPDDYRDAEIAGKPAEFSVKVHWVKQRELPALDDEFAQQVGDYADIATLRQAVETQIRQREEERVREQFEEAALSKLVEISSIEFPPQLVDHQAQHMLETLTRNVEQQGLQLAQYLRLVGKEEEAFEQEIREQAEATVRRSLALDAFANAEHIEVEPRDAQSAEPGSAEVEAAGPADPTTVQRVEQPTREQKAIARLLDLAGSDGQRDVAGVEDGEKTATWADTADTDTPSQEAAVSVASVAEEDRGTA